MSDFVWEYHKKTSEENWMPVCAGLTAWMMGPNPNLHDDAYAEVQKKCIGVYKRKDRRWWLYWEDYRPEYVFDTAEEAKAVAVALFHMGVPEAPITNDVT